MPVLLRSFTSTPVLSGFSLISLSYAPGASFSEGVSLTFLMPVLVRSFSYTPEGSFGSRFIFLLHSSHSLSG